MRNAKSQQHAKTLRKALTDAEQKLWQRLRGRQLEGCKFRRQVPIGPYIADFACLEAYLIVEVDGGQHLESSRDALRDAWFAAQGFRLLRFWNTQALVETDAVVDAILSTLQRPHPDLPPLAGEGVQREIR
ncbi:endonuclease domain-containing protein [Nevskia ramosa]|uniref:endonuclease domain-containing protein n=1 Tax=Nevskia ramosa TaxID=64002 RepID=UPI0003B696CE|nr:DUF559 domain-containing protein [Nevskia ramosa]